MNIELFKEFAILKQRISELTAEVSMHKDRMNELEPVLLEVLVAEGVASVKVDPSALRSTPGQLRNPGHILRVG